MKKYKTIETWTRAMKKDIKKKFWHDWFNIAGDWYVQEEFDDSGKYMRYTSVTARKHLDIETSNRYSELWLSDMKATSYPIEDLRFGISYYLDESITKKQLLNLVITLKDMKDIDNLAELAEYVIKKLTI